RRATPGSGTAASTGAVRTPIRSATSTSATNTASAKTTRRSQRRSISEALSEAHVNLPARVPMARLERKSEIQPQRADGTLVARADARAVLQVAEREVVALERDLPGVEEDGGADLLGD